MRAYFSKGFEMRLQLHFLNNPFALQLLFGTLAPDQHCFREYLIACGCHQISRLQLHKVALGGPLARRSYFI